MQQYFNAQFLDQITARGDQPYEAVRTRPWHYRNFNLEAMIVRRSDALALTLQVNAKMGDQLGIDMWSAQTRYNATIQTALDFTMSTKPGSEVVTEIVPHMAVVAAVYGDPGGKYSKFMARVQPEYDGKAWFLWNQRLCFTSASGLIPALADPRAASPQVEHTVNARRRRALVPSTLLHAQERCERDL